MGQVYGFLFLFFAGWLGFIVFRRLKVPSPAFLGSILATGILNAMGYYPELDVRGLSFLSKTTTGIMLGRRINRKFFGYVKDIAVYVLLLSVGMFAVSLAAGYTVYCLSDASLTTALIGGAAAGIIEMTAFGMSVNADAVAILFMQLFRFVLSCALSSWIINFVGKTVTGKAAGTRLEANSQEAFFNVCDYVLLIGAALLGAWLFITLSVPNGAMMGAMFSCGFLAICLRKSYRFKPKIAYIVQITLGIVISKEITSDVVRELYRLFLPAAVASAVTLTGSTILALLLYKFTPFDIATCVLCTSPAGPTQSIFLADELGTDSLTVSIFQTCRLLSVIALYPWIVTGFA